MRAAHSITEMIFGGDTEPPPCLGCGGIGLIGIAADEAPELCGDCGGSGFGSVLSPEPANDPRQLRLRLGLDDGHDLDGSADQPGLDDEDFFVVDPNFLAQFRTPLSEAEMDEAAEDFARAILQGIEAFERERWSE